MSESGQKVDLRSDPMPSRDGVGLAAGRWADAVKRLADAALLGPTEDTARRVALSTVQSLVGFWVLWHLEGGFDGLKRIGYSEATIYRKIKSFRESFGDHPDTFQFPGIAVDPGAYLRYFGVDGAEREGGFPAVLVDGRSGPARLRRGRE
jgi:hypothetical protein